MEELLEQNQEQTQNNELQVVEPKPLQGVTMWNNTMLFNQTYKMASIVANSDIVPQSYKGKVGNCIIAIDIANRMGLSPMAIMQNSQVVQGNFSWKGTACKAMIDSCGKYKSTRYVEIGEKGTDNWGFYLEAIDNQGNVVKGVSVTIGLAKKEGWWSKISKTTGVETSKWQTMPELMLKYRAAAFFMRTECASIAMGFLTAEENEDVYGQEKEEQKSITKLLDEEN